MLDFLVIATRSGKRGIIEIYPKFIIKKSSDLMIMLVHCPNGGVCFGLADLRWETPAQAGYGRAGHSAGGLCETQSYGWTFWRFRVNGLARHSRSGDGDMVAA